MGSAGGAVLVPLATGAVTVDKACNVRLWTDRKGQEAVRDDRERSAILNKVAHELKLENEVIWHNAIRNAAPHNWHKKLASTTARSRPPRWTPILVVVVAAVAIVAIPSVREPVLRAAGWALVVNEPVAPADIIVVSPESDGAGVLEAADLVQSGISTRVAVFSDPPSGEDLEFIRRGLPYMDAGAMQVRQLKWLGVTDVVQIPRTDAGTEGEGQVLPPWCDQHQFRSIVLVTARDHSRRLRRVIDRFLKGHPTRVTVQPSRYSSFDPDRWWKTRDGVRTEIVELQKLVLDAVLHPMSF
jgi:hypothetical protein